MTTPPTPLPYRIYRNEQQIAAGEFPDEGQHNMAVARMVYREHRLQADDVLVMDLKCGDDTRHIAYRFEDRGYPVAIRTPEYGRMNCEIRG